MTDTNMAPNGENLNGIVQAAGPLTMSSREIAELTGKRHDHILRDIEKMLQDIADPKFGASDFLASYTDSTGRSLKEYRLPKDLTVTLVTGYRADLRYRVVKRLDELEGRERNRPAIDLNDPAFLRSTLIVYTEKVLALQAENERLGEKAEALDRIATAEGSMCMTDAAKHLQVQPRKLIEYLSQHGWIYRRPGSGHWIGYQARIASGDLEHKVNTVLHANGEERVHEQVRVTAKGLTKLAKLLKPAVQAA